MVEEKKPLKKNFIGELVELAREKKIVKCQWVFVMKYKSNEIVDCC